MSIITSVKIKKIRPQEFNGYLNLDDEAEHCNATYRSVLYGVCFSICLDIILGTLGCIGIIKGDLPLASFMFFCGIGPLMFVIISIPDLMNIWKGHKTKEYNNE